VSATGDLQPAAMRVRDAATALALPIVIKSMAEATRTAEEAAAACGCDVAQIVKSLVFTGATSGSDYLLLVSGANRVDETGVAEVIGEALVRPRANHVREVTGYAIGGIPPFGHKSPLKTYIDKDLLAFDKVWAAAGTPNTVFSCDPKQLRDAIGATTIAVS
jgi:prolyl-tRNA editing enzyme YbaK/EbsC (Cys-tRNA(Pro) deacylase)